MGFEEREITVFLNQFGNVKRCRVSRSKKTGRSRGYAFVDFADHEVAKIVAETMSGYFLLEKRLVCHLLPMDKVHELMFARPKRPVSKAAMQKKAMLEVNKRRSVEVLKGITAKLVEREELKRKKLAALGIDYDFPGYAASAQAVAANRGAVDSESGSKRKMPVDIEETEDNTAKDANESKAAKTPKSNKKKSKKGKESNAELAEKSEEVEKTEAAEKKSEKKKRKKSGDEPTESVPETPSQTEVEKSSKKSAKKTKTEKTPSKTKTPKSAKSSSKKKKSAE